MRIVVVLAICALGGCSVLGAVLGASIGAAYNIDDRVLRDRRQTELDAELAACQQAVRLAPPCAPRKAPAAHHRSVGRWALVGGLIGLAIDIAIFAEVARECAANHDCTL